MIGTNTALFDNPQLTVRDWNGRNPVRIVLDKKLRLNNKLKIYDKLAITYIFNSKKNEIVDNIHFIKIDFEKNSLNQVMDILYEKEIQSIVIEGGRELLNSFIKNNLWDEARVFIGDIIFSNGVKAPNFNQIAEKEIFINESKLMYYRNK